MTDRIDNEGYRANVGIILCNGARKLFLAGRVGGRGWQFPQGGIQGEESPHDAMYRELREEVGLRPDDVEVVAHTEHWLRYRLPRRFQRRNAQPLCIGQKQRWFLLRLKVSDNAVRLDCADEPEFDRWRWVEFWQPLDEVIYFKRRVYERALAILGPMLYPNGPPPRPTRAAPAKRNGRKR